MKVRNTVYFLIFFLPFVYSLLSLPQGKRVVNSFFSGRAEIINYNSQALKFLLRSHLNKNVEKIIGLFEEDEGDLPGLKKMWGDDIEDSVMVIFKSFEDEIEFEILVFRRNYGWVAFMGFDKGFAEKNRVLSIFQVPKARKIFTEPQDGTYSKLISFFRHFTRKNLDQIFEKESLDAVKELISRVEPTAFFESGITDLNEMRNIHQRFQNNTLVKEYYQIYQSWPRRVENRLNKLVTQKKQLELRFSQAIHIDKPLKILKSDRSYPMIALKGRIQGQVIVDVLVDYKGKVLEVRSISGHPILMEGALKDVRKWEFSPLEKNEQKKDIWFTVTLSYNLKQEK